MFDLQTSCSKWCQGYCEIYDIRLKLLSNSNLAKSRSPITFVAVIQSSWNYTQSTVVSLPCSVQNFKTIGRLRIKLSLKESSRDLTLRCFSDVFPILHKAPGFIPRDIPGNRTCYMHKSLSGNVIIMNSVNKYMHKCKGWPPQTPEFMCVAVWSTSTETRDTSHGI